MAVGCMSSSVMDKEACAVFGQQCNHLESMIVVFFNLNFNDFVEFSMTTHY